ncbi:MAG: c-type cytochrome [Bdellovibrionales bacterium]|nr:c-type cytochrome [Bdellovibrionales bacterium]
MKKRTVGLVAIIVIFLFQNCGQNFEPYEQLSSSTTLSSETSEDSSSLATTDSDNTEDSEDSSDTTVLAPQQNQEAKKVFKKTVANPAKGLLNVYPRICELDPSTQKCVIRASWSVKNSDRLCLFVKEDKKRIACANASTTFLDWIKKDKQYHLELRYGSFNYDQAKLLDSVLVTSVSKAPNLYRAQYEDRREKRQHAMAAKGAGFSTSSWDGRLQFGSVALKTGVLGLTVRTFRPERLEGVATKDLNLQDVNLTSDVYIYESDRLTAADKQSLTNDSRIKRFKGLNHLGFNYTGANIGFHLAVYPYEDGNLPNPYPSSSNGTPQAGGAFETYKVYAILPTNKAGNVASPYFLRPGAANSGRKSFLTKFLMAVIVAKPKSKDASIYNVRMLSRAIPMYDVRKNLLHGYEPSVTLNGQLIVYSSNFSPAKNVGNGGTVGYSYTSNPHSNSLYSVPENLARMYYRNGPGATRETQINGHNFSDEFPIAKKPIRQYDGTPFGPNDVISGAYPWVSFTGSEAFFSSIPGFHGPSRFGTTIVGRRTNYILRRLDGQNDRARGNVIDRYDVFDGTTDPDDKKLNQALHKGYENAIYPNTNAKLGFNSWFQTLMMPIGQYPSSWSALSSLNQSPLPLSPFRESYGFILAGNRYAEVSFPDFPKDLLLYYPMQEPYKYNKPLVNNYIINQKSDDNYRRDAISFVTNQVADYSGLFHTGRMNSGVQYPYEFYNAKAQWNNRGIIYDRSEGFYGNSVIFRQNGLITTGLGRYAMAKLSNSQSYSISFWFKKTQNGLLPLVSSPSLFGLWLKDTSLFGTVLTQEGQQTKRSDFTAASVISNGSWNHITLTFNHGHFRVWLNGKTIIEKIAPGTLPLNLNASYTPLYFGPNGKAAPAQRFSLDEVYLYAIELPEKEIKALAYLKEVKATTNVKKELIQLGRTLFRDPTLSATNKVSCASCHSIDNGFADSDSFSVGVLGRKGSRNSPSIINTSSHNDQFWDGSAPSLASQVLHPIINPAEMGISDLDQLKEEISYKYGDHFKKIFGTSKVTTDMLSHTLANYVASVKTRGTNPLTSIGSTASIDRGRRLFNGKANCIACHSGKLLSDNLYHDIGLDKTNDFGQGKVLGLSLDTRRAMRTPSLLNVSKTAPYFHDGRANSLREVVEFYNRGGDDTSAGRNVRPQIRPLSLSAQNISDLVDYLESLDRPHSQ